MNNKEKLEKSKQIYMTSFFPTKTGDMCIVIEYNNAHDLTIMFEDGTIVYNICSSNLTKGLIKNPNYYKTKLINIKFKCNNEIVTIIEYNNAHDITIQFEDGTIINNIQLSNLKTGNVKNKNPLKLSNSIIKNLYNIGYLGIGKYNSINNPYYSYYLRMFHRCYNINMQQNFKHETYADCFIDEKWHNFQNFCEWCETNYIEGFQLDKDILIKGNKKYGPDTCCFVPNEINMLFNTQNSSRGNLLIGAYKSGDKFTSYLGRTYLGSFFTENQAFQAYKSAKEKHMKEIANIWKDKIKLNIYDTIYNYNVEIND
jgi:hypothetical protein